MGGAWWPPCRSLRGRRVNAFQQRGREKKAQAIARLVWRNIPPELRTNPALAAGVADTPQYERESFARIAQQRKPSDLTWARVAEIVGERVADERHLLDQLADHRAAS